MWFHVDGAYGGAALAAPSVRDRFDGIEHADSFIVDPHKWLFAPFDCCALLYRDPRIAKAAHTQHAEYLDVLHIEEDWNASDYAHHLSRRARGLPFWFSLATYGTDAYRDAIETTIEVAHAGARLIAAERLLRAGHRARAVGRRVPPHRLDRRPVPGVERRAAPHAAVVRGAHVVARRDGAAVLRRQPEHHRRRSRQILESLR